ncbi:phosphocarrier, HPr family [Gluconacetobacter diazotrophicus PA1 5]|uniref:Phosphoenolpyruvate-protein phosphotransferase ptsP n=1 Tax=Gluconacetobacter diazotrophicus (strain ATCC 49037 / DSM 5601 / CCUG 37298 / CIP 103539 / LMG 7603 / PAl5) TaxID=272568 RepID=A9H2W1_GLUDA|nr:HPr family phosphocarrier protein [Gluconacetobacter diazotrophicus]ACI52084.1 phosphocarrier, HPr family [Gluconacetobacter diazotrophicus PA1 5]TWB02793.1 phosphocarrier protein HPr [Gluconacetobacter diazotrophicus]CAP54208.1 Phosphoenolpyruvate-protein phosphotransferase ptsP [Gluconacetobacter diazotrophicus PA1 5]
MDAPDITAPTALLLVSHSAALAEATEALIRQMTGTRVAIARAAGAGPGGRDLGTDPMAIVAAAESLPAACGAIVVLMDIGSALLSADMARDLMPAGVRARLHLSPAAFVEGALAAALAAAAGLPVERVLAEAENGLAAKRADIAPSAPQPQPKPMPSPATTTATARRAVTLADPAGLHLRPAAAFVTVAAGYDADIRLTANGRSARADSLTALLTLDAAAGATVTIEASGPQAEAAVAALATLLAQAPEAPPPDLPAPPATGPIPVSPGRVAGPLHVVDRAPLAIPDHPAPDRDAARIRLRAAIDATFGRLSAGPPIMAAQATLLHDPALVDAAYAAIQDAGLNEAAAWWRAVLSTHARYGALDAPYLRARGQDVIEVGRAVLQRLLPGTGPRDLAVGPAPCILLVDTLTAAEAASLPASVIGVLDRQGGATSHAAILLRGAGIPALAGVTLDPVPRTVAFDGASGEIVPDPDPATARRFQSPPSPAPAAGPSVLPLRDGTGLELWANVGTVRESLAAAAAGAHGIGLARTEILFLDRPDAPAEAEQAERIAALLAPFRGRPVVVRALDAGADKPIPFLALDPEDNPALGVRGLRALLRRPAFFRTHLRAILRAGGAHDLRIMLPMVTVAEEMRAARGILADACREAGTPIPPLGAMIEVPAAALRIEDLVAETDFFSIGTNDLTQYVMAAERGRQDFAAFADAAHPAVIDLCAHVVRHANGRSVSVCGEAAGDPRAARLLVAAGIRRLSMAATRLGAIRAAFAA